MEVRQSNAAAAAADLLAADLDRAIVPAGARVHAPLHGVAVAIAVMGIVVGVVWIAVVVVAIIIGVEAKASKSAAVVKAVTETTVVVKAVMETTVAKSATGH